MTLKQTLNEAIKEAMKSRQTARLATLRFLSAAIKQKEVDERVELNDQQIQQIIEKQIKQRKESIAAFEQAGREESAASERAEIEVLSEFMPEQVSQDELNAAIDAVVNELKAQGLSGGQAMGKAMGVLKAQFAGRADMALVSKWLKEKLS
ncbi:glutamyl-tRNA amidotransferase [Basilea psittacipulmonis DSM 24701]|uniref:Glutamyl-tRNA amidotransferase n=2 Tax=Basilea TaxID=1472344 RepID=A0A077DDV6_9BURK|nr:glutamyl-tRNA amidotransferase [Basilea psittacipulmonis DSM 24701]